MRPRIPLPPELREAPFLVREGLDRGLGENRLRGRDLPRPFHGVRGEGPTPAHSYAPRLRPGDRFSHTTAAALWGIPLPSGEEHLHVTATLPAGRARSAGVIGHVTARDSSVIRQGVPVSDAPTLFVELGALLRRRSRSRGSRRARRAIRLVRSGAESRPESLLRVLLVQAGLPEPELNVDVADLAGRWIGRFDLVYRHHRVIVEYDGDQHRSSVAQYEKDIIRIERAQHAGWVVIRVRARALFRAPNEVVARVRRALAHPR